ncbi:MAG: LamG domain-containing protein [Clostridia bacterium]|nr:LamG domain-containing protein [Clostridia bacterium]
MKSQKGITLLTLIITIIVILILAGITITSGTDALKTSKKTAFISELEMVQAKINIIYEKMKLNKEDIEYYKNLGKDITILGEEKLNEILKATNKEGFRYFQKEDLKKIDIENISQELLINFETREVISVNGIQIDGVKYYKLTDIQSYGVNNIEYVEKNNKSPNFNVELQKLPNSWKFRIVDISYNSNVKQGTVSYKLHNQTNWIIEEGYEFEVRTAGLYDIKFTDKAGNSKVLHKYIYVQEGIILNLDGEGNTRNGHIMNSNIWEDLSGNNNDIILNNFNHTVDSGWIGKGLKFDGQDDFGICQTLKNSDNMTIEVVFKSESISNTRGIVGWISSKEVEPRLGMYIQNNKLYKYSLNDNLINGAYVQNELNQSELLVATLTTNLNNKEFTHFKNGKQIGKIDNVNTISNTSNLYFAIGDYADSNGNYTGQNSFKGEIYQIRIYNRVLTQEEINKNYEIDQFRFNI